MFCLDAPTGPGERGAGAPEQWPCLYCRCSHLTRHPHSHRQNLRDVCSSIEATPRPPSLCCRPGRPLYPLMSPREPGRRVSERFHHSGLSGQQQAFSLCPGPGGHPVHSPGLGLGGMEMRTGWLPQDGPAWQGDGAGQGGEELLPGVCVPPPLGALGSCVFAASSGTPLARAGWKAGPGGARAAPDWLCGDTAPKESF